MRCTNQVPELNENGQVKLRRPKGCYWAPCQTAMILSGEPAPHLLKGDGRAPVSIQTYTCPACGASQTIQDFGQLDGVKKTPKKDLYKVKAPRVQRLKYYMRWATQDGHGHEEQFSTAKEMRLAEPRIRYTADAITSSVEMLSR